MLADDSDGSIWIGTEAGLSRFRDGRFVNYTAKDGLADAVRGLYRDTDGSLWIGTIQRIHLQMGQTAAFSVQRFEGPAPRGEVWSMVRDRENAMWLGTLDGLFRIKDGRSTRYTTEDGLASNRMRSIMLDADGVLWIGTTSGVTTYDKGVFTSHTFGAGGGFVVRREHDDRRSRRQHLDWIADRRPRPRAARAIHQLRCARRPARRLRCHRHRRQSGHDSGSARMRGSARSGTDACRPLPRTNGLPQTLISSRDRRSDGTICGSATEVGVFKSAQPLDCRRRARAIPSFVQVTDGFARVLFEDRDGTLWIGTNLDGLASYRSGVLTKYTMKDGLPNNAVRAIQQDRDGSLWIGTRGGGLARFKDGDFTTYTEKDGLATSGVQALFMDRDNTLWIGTRQGLNRFKDGKFTTYTVNDGLYSSFVYNIVEDDLGSLWMSCSKGAFSVSKRELE